MPGLPSPLHPALVHLPIALATLLPLLAFLGALAIARGWLPVRSWACLVLLHAILVGSAWAAEEVGHREHEKVEDVVPREAIHEHEERGELVVVLSAATFLVTAAGLLGSRAGAVARGLAVLSGLALLVAVVRAGESGGEVAYRYGGASVYREKAAEATPGAEGAPAR
ncbi:MAG TPA: DUF2231 domain-containing protein [Myxococcota bacterium]|jgi:uncharacterized membrane protein|nr:DUF2231 domain-containing protein [Myxococcota bacterium]